MSLIFSSERSLISTTSDSCCDTNSHDLTARRVIFSPMKQELGLTNNLQLRFLGPGDVNEVKNLCGKWFPIEYVYFLFFFRILSCFISPQIAIGSRQSLKYLNVYICKLCALFVFCNKFDTYFKMFHYFLRCFKFCMVLYCR